MSLPPYHIKNCHLGQNWKDCPACVEQFNETNPPSKHMKVTTTTSKSKVFREPFVIRKPIKKPIVPRKGLRMYFLLLYNLSGIQKGIQAGHAALEYAEKFGARFQYKDFVQNHKTFILLDVGGSKEMKRELRRLREEFNWDVVTFQEPDLGNQVTAAAFIVPEDVYAFDQESQKERLSPNDRMGMWLKKFQLARGG